MFSNQISPFEYVSIFVSIILGLGLTQLLSAFSDLLYHIKKVKFYWPHNIWIIFILFLHIQDWFITYELKDKPVWHLPELCFLLLYPVSLFCAAKMLLPTNDKEEKNDMKLYFQSQYKVIFVLVSISICISIAFNVYFLQNKMVEQLPQLLFLIILMVAILKKDIPLYLHKIIAILILIASIISVMLEQNKWVIK